MNIEVPTCIEAERTILGQSMLDPDVLPGVVDLLTDEHFYRDAHKALWRILSDLNDRNEPTDLVTVSAVVSKTKAADAVGGWSYLSTLSDNVPATINSRHYARMIRETADRRAMIERCQSAAAMAASGETMEAVTAHLYAESPADSMGDDDVRHVSDVMADYLKDLHERVADHREGRVTGLPVPLADLRRFLLARRGQLGIIAARPGAGKSALALQWMLHAAQQGSGVLKFSLEMVAEDLVERQVASESRTDLGKLGRGEVSDEEINRLMEDAARVAELPMWICDKSNVTVEGIAARTRRMRRQRADLALVVVDYIGLVKESGKSRSREDAVRHVSRTLKVLANDERVLVLALSQLNRKCEERADKRPMLSDLRDSGAIEQDADWVLLGYRDDLYNPESIDAGMAEWNIAKQRRGKAGVAIKVAFEGQYTRFSDLARHEGYDYP